MDNGNVDPSEPWDYPTVPVNHRVKASDFNPRVPYTIEGPGSNERTANRVFWSVLIGILVVLVLGVFAASLRS